MLRPRVACVVGTRPDAIKSAPVVLALRKNPNIETILIATGQHREMLDQALGAFELESDENLDLMRHGQSLADLTASATSGLHELFTKLNPDYVTAQGDTTTTFVASLVSFYNRVPFGHIEAGLRTHDLDNPFPEEYNRRACAIVAKHHFAPTRWAAQNLEQEGVDSGIYITGNTGIDAVLAVANKHEQTWLTAFAGRVVLLTTHRRENWGGPQEAISRAARRIVERFPDVQLVVPMHRNPAVRETLRAVLGGHERIALIDPPDYPSFVKLMQRSYLIVSDSGGVQEEAPAFGVPTLVLRKTTERPEGVDAGVAKLVGTDETAVFSAMDELLSNSDSRQRMATASSPYGDGHASERIASVISCSLGVEAEVVPMWG